MTAIHAFSSVMGRGLLSWDEAAGWKFVPLIRDVMGALGIVSIYRPEERQSLFQKRPFEKAGCIFI